MNLENEILDAKILIVDDQKIHVLLLEKILKTAGYKNIQNTTDSSRAVRFFQEFQPDLLLLDLKMPKVDGFDVLNQVKNIIRDEYLPILALSSEKGQEVRLKALGLGATDVLNKPYENAEVLTRTRNMIETRLLHIQIRRQNKILDEKVRDRTKELRETRLDIIHRLARAAEFRDNDTGIHIIRMSKFCARLAEAIGMNESQTDLILNASPLHDIGKIGIPDKILLKPGPLNPEEWEIMKTHTTMGAELLSGSHFALMKMAETIALTHHEYWNGKGYPQGLKEEGIPLAGRITCVCDVFDALTSVRPYKQAWTVQKALEEIQKQKNLQFDPQIVDTFVKIFPDICRIKNEYSEQGSS